MCRRSCKYKIFCLQIDNHPNWKVILINPKLSGAYYTVRSVIHVSNINSLKSVCHLLEGKIKGEMEVTRRRGRRRKKFLDDLREGRGYSHLKEEALNCTMWKNHFGGAIGPVIRQTAEWMNEWMNLNSVIKCGIIFWGNSSNSGKIFTLQKKFFRSVVSAWPRTPYRSLFKN